MPDVTATPAAQPGNWVDPYRAYNFKLLINGVTDGHFTEVSGLGVQVERISYREAGNDAVVRAIPGRVTYSLGDAAVRPDRLPRTVGLADDRGRGPGQPAQRLGGDARLERHHRGAALEPDQRLARRSGTAPRSTR